MGDYTFFYNVTIVTTLLKVFPFSSHALLVQTTELLGVDAFNNSNFLVLMVHSKRTEKRN